MNRLGFKNTLIVVVIGLLIVALGITSYLSISKLEETAKSSLITSITDSSQYEAESIHRYISQHAQPVVSLAALYKKNNYQQDHEKYLEVGNAAANATKLTLGFDDGRSFTSRASETFPGGVGITLKYDPRTRSWYQLGKKSTGLALSDVFATK
jgi:methyl-accepting chemotaxis protein